MAWQESSINAKTSIMQKYSDKLNFYLISESLSHIIYSLQRGGGNFTVEKPSKYYHNHKVGVNINNRTNVLPCVMIGEKYYIIFLQKGIFLESNYEDTLDKPKVRSILQNHPISSKNIRALKSNERLKNKKRLNTNDK